MIEKIHAYLEARPEGAEAEELLSLVFPDGGDDTAFGSMFLRRLLATDPRFLEDGGRWYLRQDSLLDRSVDDAPLVVVDLETTGQRQDQGGITEIGAVRLQGRREVGRFETLVDPGRPIPPYVVRLTGISDSMVAGAPRIEEVLPAFLEFAEGAVLVAHNAAFDVALLDRESRRILGRPLGAPSLCTLKLARRLMPELSRASLDALASHFTLAKASRHRALADAELTVAVLFRMWALAFERGVRTIGDLLAVQHDIDASQPSAMHIRRRSLEKLPEGRGVYRLLDGHGSTLFVSKARNVRSEVLGYFLDGDHLSARQRRMVASVHDVDFAPCHSEVEAAIVEAEQIRRWRPEYNRGDRHLPRGHFIKVSVRRPWPRVSVAGKISSDGALYVGPLRGRAFVDDAAALLARLYGLRTCPGRLEPSESFDPCWLAEPGWCSSPCNGSIDAGAYAKRVADLEKALAVGGGPLKQAIDRASAGEGAQRNRDSAVLGRLLKLHRKRHWLVNRHYYVAAVEAAGGGLLVAAVIAGFCRALLRPATAEELRSDLAGLAERRRRRTTGRSGAMLADVSTILAYWTRTPAAHEEGVVIDLDPKALDESLAAAAEELAPLLPE